MPVGTVKVFLSGVFVLAAVVAASTSTTPAIYSACTTVSGDDMSAGGGSSVGVAPVAVTTHASGLECVVLQHPDGARVAVTLHGAHVLEWTAPGSSNNILFVSKESIFDGQKAIRGGIPLVFPQFGDGLDGPTGLPSHGFARISKWAFVGGGLDELSFAAAPFGGGTVFAEFALTSDDVHDPVHSSPWLNGAIAFRLLLRVELAPSSLSTSLTIANTATPGVRACRVLAWACMRVRACVCVCVRARACVVRARTQPRP